MSAQRPSATSLKQLPQFWLYDGMPHPDGYCHVGFIHAPEMCEAPCPYHSPSEHPLNDAPMALAIVFTLRIPMRVCEHEFLHPDPDGLQHLHRVGALWGPTTHTCCPERCCGGAGAE